MQGALLRKFGFFHKLERITPRLAAVAVAVALGAAPADAAERWLAVSNTAISITGDALLTPGRLGFQAGGALEWMAVPGGRFRVGGQERSAIVLRVRHPDDPALLHGNRLCGSGLVTFLAIWEPVRTAGEPAGRELAVFTGAEPPHDADGACAIYGYEAAPAG